MGSTGWNGQEQAMATVTGEDQFDQLFDMNGMANLGDGMQFNFQDFQDGTNQGLMSHQQREAADAIMTDSDNQNMMNSNAVIPVTTAGGQASIPAHMMNPPSDSISTIDAQIQYLQQQKFQQQQRQLQEQHAVFYGHNHSVPPTPQSMEMPNSGQFYSQPEQHSQPGVFDAGYHQRVKEQDMAFTPLVSPAVTPLDPHFNGTYVTQSTYFSPLTSPALHARDDSVLYDHAHSSNSPVDMDLADTSTPPGQSLDLSKKAKKKVTTKPRSTKSSRVQSSPIVKPQRRKTGPSPAIVSHVLSEIDENNANGMDAAFLPMPAASADNSPDDNSSVSPEALSEMPPPPVPARRSTSKSPYIQAQRGGSQTPVSGPQDMRPAPATPASLMKLPASKNKSIQGTQEPMVTDHIESLELPESVSNRPLAPVGRGPLMSSVVELSAPKGTGFQSMHSPVFPKPSGTTSASASPLLAPGSSGPSARKTPQFGPRNGRKRSTGSVHVSPALLPRISPNIKPLLPGGATSAEDAASRLLMSKSNYQNILEGNTVPGVSYPPQLSTNLTSKRTSHKIAEQGRRNRINSALQIMAGLLPGGDDGKVELTDEPEKKDGKPSNVQNSKASVVENAIVHMKHLTKENTDLKDEVEALKRQLAEIKAGDS